MSERHALPHRPLPRGLVKLESVPPPCAESGAPTPSPLRCLLHGTSAAVPETAAPNRHPDFGAPGLLTASQTCLGPGPGARTAPGKALTLHRAREGLALAARVHGRRLGDPRPAGVPGCAGCRSTWCKDFSFDFSTPPQPSFSQLCEAGRTDVKPAPLPLPRGRWPARPHSLALHQRLPGEAAGQSRRPGPRGPGLARSPGTWKAHTRPRGQGDRGRRGMRAPPAPLSSWPTRLASPPLAPLHLPPWVPKAARQPGRGCILQTGPRRAAVGGWGPGGHSGCGGLGRNPR